MARSSTHSNAGTSGGGGEARPQRPLQEREERLRALRDRWHDLETQYVAARERNAQQLMSNLRGLMLSVKREIGRQGGELPEFPYTPAQRRKMHLPPVA